MDQIQHKFIEVQGLKLHVAELGNGPNVVVFLHGFPEIWYSWRHQMISLAGAGFRAIAPDYRGYGLSDAPQEPQRTSFSDLVRDLLGILDNLGIAKVFLVAKDFGARPAFDFALSHADRVLGVLTLGVPFMPPGPSAIHNHLPEGFYVSRWMEPGRAEADFGRLDAKTVIRNVYILFSKSEVPVAAENQEIMDLVDSSVPLPRGSLKKISQLTELYMRNLGFKQPCRFHTGNGAIPTKCMPFFFINLPPANAEFKSLTEVPSITNPKITVPALLIMGEKDYVLKFPGIEDYIRSETIKLFVPDLEIIFLPEGTHFVQEQSPEEVNRLILTFLNKHI